MRDDTDRSAAAPRSSPLELPAPSSTRRRAKGATKKARKVAPKHGTAAEAAAANDPSSDPASDVYVQLPVRTVEAPTVLVDEVPSLHVHHDDVEFLDAAVDMGRNWFGADRNEADVKAYKTDYEFFGVPVGWVVDPARLRKGPPPVASLVPPARQLVRGTALKLHLALLHDVEGRPNPDGTVQPLRPEAFAPVVGLRAYNGRPGPALQKRGRDRITSAAQLLADNGLLTIDGRSTANWKMTLKAADGTGGAYFSASKTNQPYLRFPSALVRNGWLCALSNRALVALAVLLHQWSIQGRRWPAQTGRTLIEQVYEFDPETFRVGCRELRGWGLLTWDGRAIRHAGGPPDNYRTESKWTFDVDRMRTRTPDGLIADVRLWPSASSRFPPATAYGKAARRLERRDLAKLTRSKVRERLDA